MYSLLSQERKEPIEKQEFFHIGIILEDSRTKYPSVKVRLDKIGEDGIINLESGKKRIY